MKLSAIKTFASTRKKGKTKDGTPSKSVYGGIGSYYPYQPVEEVDTDGDGGDGGGDGGGGGGE